jgi:hypothetical protein
VESVHNVLPGVDERDILLGIQLLDIRSHL